MTSEPDSPHAINRNAQHDQSHDLFKGEAMSYLQDPSLLLNASPHYYLKTPELVTLLEHLQVTVTGRGEMQVILAEHGRGKSSLLRQLIVENANHWLLCHIHAEYQLGVDHIINGLGQAFFPQEDIDFESLVHGLVSYGHRAPYPVVIVDDAQNLSSYAIETLANIKRAVAEQGGDVDIILCATPLVRKILLSYGMSPFRDKWLKIHSLPRFTEEETARYLNNRFEQAGEVLFTPSQLQLIHQRACGIPASINYHAELILGHTVSDERLRLAHEQILVRKKKLPYFIGGAVVAALLLAVIVSSLFEAPQEVVAERDAVASITSALVFEQAVRDVDAPTAKAAAVTARVVEKEVKPSPVEPKQAVKSLSTPKPKPIPEPVIKKSIPPVVKAKPKQASPVTLATAVTTEEEMISRPAMEKPKSSMIEVIPKQFVAQAPESKLALQPKLKPIPINQLSTVKAAAMAVEEESIPGVAWLKAQPPENYTIQLAGSPVEKDIIRYIRRSSLEGELAYVYMKRKNRSGWYVVLHGSFESRAAAQRVVEFFPPELRKNKPWVREISKLQKVLDDE